MNGKPQIPNKERLLSLQLQAIDAAAAGMRATLDRRFVRARMDFRAAGEIARNLQSSKPTKARDA